MLGESKRRSAPISAMHKRRLLERLELLCTCGAGMEAIAPAICAIFRELGGADSGSVFWLDEAGIAGGFFHDCAPVEINDFFISHFDEFFSNPDEVNMVGMLRPIPPHIGKALDPDYQGA